MNRVTSKDGTSIAYDRPGSGPAVILVGGAFVDRSENAPLATELAELFTVYNYDRRGRGESGDTLPYADAPRMTSGTTHIAHHIPGPPMNIPSMCAITKHLHPARAWSLKRQLVIVPFPPCRLVRISPPLHLLLLPPEGRSRRERRTQSTGGP